MLPPVRTPSNGRVTVDSVRPSIQVTRSRACLAVILADFRLVFEALRRRDYGRLLVTLPMPRPNPSRATGRPEQLKWEELAHRLLSRSRATEDPAAGQGSASRFKLLIIIKWLFGPGHSRLAEPSVAPPYAPNKANSSPNASFTVGIRQKPNHTAHVAHAARHHSQALS